MTVKLTKYNIMPKAEAQFTRSGTELTATAMGLFKEGLEADKINGSIFKEQFNKILFYTKANYVLSECDIFINAVHYNMTVDNKIATKYFYLNDGGNYDWNVTCN
jgi:hypothetical protein